MSWSSASSQRRQPGELELRAMQVPPAGQDGALPRPRLIGQARAPPPWEVVEAHWSFTTEGFRPPFWNPRAWEGERWGRIWFWELLAGVRGGRRSTTGGYGCGSKDFGELLHAQLRLALAKTSAAGASSACLACQLRHAGLRRSRAPAPPRGAPPASCATFAARGSVSLAQ